MDGGIGPLALPNLMQLASPDEVNYIEFAEVADG